MNTQRTLSKAIVVSAILVGMAYVSAVSAETLNLSFTSLPSAQGWSYMGPQPETAVMQLSDGVLGYNTLSISEYTAYFRDSLNWDTDAFIIEFTMKTTEMVGDAGYNPFSAGIGVGNGEYFTNVGIAPTYVGVDIDGTTGAEYIVSGLDNSAFHNYKWKGTFGEDWTLFRDCVPILTGDLTTTIPYAGINQIWFGDGTLASNAVASFSSFSFRTVPEPSAMILTASLFAVSGATLLVRRKSKRGRS